MAKDSLKYTSVISTKVIPTDLKIKSKIFVKNLWKDRWAKIENNKLKSILKTPNEKFNMPTSNSKDNAIVTRLRIGYTNLTHSYLIKNENPPVCNCNSILTVNHIFDECQLNNSIKMKYNIPNRNFLKNLDVSKVNN